VGTFTGLGDDKEVTGCGIDKEGLGVVAFIIGGAEYSAPHEDSEGDLL